MAYDGVVLHQTINLLQDQLVSGRINKIYQVSNYELLFQIRVHRKNVKFLLSCHPMYARMQLTTLDFPTVETPNALTMLFRKHLEGGYIQSIEQVELDRIARIKFACHNEFGDLVEYYCMIEIMAKHSNILLTNQDGKILDCVKRISPSMNSIRILQPGAMYQLPPMDESKKNPFQSNYIPCSSLTKVYQGVSPILSREILYRLDQNQSYESILDEIKQSDCLYCSTVDQKEYFHIIPLTHLQVLPTQYELFEGLDKYFGFIDQKDRIKQQTSNLLRFISNEYTKNCTKHQKLLQTLDSSKNSDTYRICGDLLYSNLHLVTKGMKHVVVDNYYDDTKLTINLDERFDGKQNAKRYYAKYQKAKNSISYLQEQIDLTKKEIEYFDGLLTLLDNASYYDALEIKEELEQLGYVKKKQQRHKNKKKSIPKFDTFVTKDDIEICIGKNNLQNDYLTFKHANRYDTWFHAQDMPGSHIVVKSDELDEYTIRLASTIAAYYSKGKTSNSVPVSYTFIKNLKKIPGGKPGQVIVSNYKTIYIDPDASCLEELTKK